MSPRRSVPPQKKNKLPNWLIVGSITGTIALFIVVALDFWSKVQPPSSSPSSSNRTADSRTIGNPNAPIAFTEFSDFQ